MNPRDKNKSDYDLQFERAIHFPMLGDEVIVSQWGYFKADYFFNVLPESIAFRESAFMYELDSPDYVLTEDYDHLTVLKKPYLKSTTDGSIWLHPSVVERNMKKLTCSIHARISLVLLLLKKPEIKDFFDALDKFRAIVSDEYLKGIGDTLPITLR